MTDAWTRDRPPSEAEVGDKTEAVVVTHEGDMQFWTGSNLRTWWDCKAQDGAKMWFALPDISEPAERDDD